MHTLTADTARHKMGTATVEADEMNRTRPNHTITAAIVLGIIAFAFLVVVGIAFIKGRNTDPNDPVVKKMRGDREPAGPNDVYEANDFLNSHADAPARVLDKFHGKVIKLTGVNVNAMVANENGDGYTIRSRWTDKRNPDEVRYYYIRCTTKQAAKYAVGEVATMDVFLVAEIEAELNFQMPND